MSDVSAMVLLIKRSIAFADWAAGEGICPVPYDGEEAEARNPDEFLFAYSTTTGDEEWSTLADRVTLAFEDSKAEIGRLTEERDRIERNRDMYRGQVERQSSTIGLLRDALFECEEYFDNRSDADCDQDGFIPSEEMKLLQIVREALKKAGA